MNTWASSDLRVLLRVVVLASCALAVPRVVAAQTPPPDASTAESEQPLTAELQQCVDDHERARVSQVEGRLPEAFGALERCAVDQCPLAVRADCRAWLTELKAALPSVVLLFEDSGASEDVKVTIDGQPLDAAASLGPIELMPGAHVLRFELDPYAPLEERVELESGQKNHVVRVRFARPRETPSTPVAGPPRPVPQTDARPGPVRMDAPAEGLRTSVVLGGGALLAAGASVAFLFTALKAQDDAERLCAPNCSEDVRQAIDTRLVLADASGLLSLALGAFALKSFINEQDAKAHVGVQASADRAGLSFWGAF